MVEPAFRGIIPPLVTPLDEQREIDLDGTERLIDRTIGGGVHGLFVLGTTGEGPSLPISMRRLVVDTTCELVHDRVPVFVGITDTIAEGSLYIADAAHAAGADAVVLAPPYYLPMTQDELVSYTLRLLKNIELPVMLYNMPSCCKTWFDVESVVELSKQRQIVGLKDSSGDLEYFGRVRQAVDRSDFALFVGPEEMLVECVRRGAHGGVNGGAQMFPQLYVRMYEAAAEGRWEDAERLQTLVQAVSDSIYTVSDGPSRIIKGIKSVLRELSVCGDQMAEPFLRHSEEGRGQIQQRLTDLLSKLGPLSASSAV